MSVLSSELRLRIVSALVRGNSIADVVAQTGVAKTTVLRLLVKVGEACARLHYHRVRGLAAHMIEVDEQWSFIAKKDKRCDADDPPEHGDVFTYTALDANSRLVIAYFVGKRTQANTDTFIADLRSRLTVVPQITSDGLQMYVTAIGQAFETVDYGQVVKQYGYAKSPDHKYEPARDAHFIRKKAVFGAPDLSKASTSYTERFHLTMRHKNGRKRRLSVAFSRKLDNHKASIALNVAHYCFCHVVRTLGATPAMVAGLTAAPWSLDELLREALAAPPIPEEPPDPPPLALRPGAGAARELPGGRGWLRAVPNASVERQGDLFDWAARKPPEKPLPPPGTQLSLFDDDQAP